MPDAFSKMEILLGDTDAEKLSRAKIAVFGLGGIGSYAAEALARCGVASLTLIDNECVSVSDINRQLYALRSTVGKTNVQIAKARIKDIDEGILVHTYETFYNEETCRMFDLSQYDYIVDAMNELDSKLLLIERAKDCGTPMISCMDIEDRLDFSRLEIADIAKIKASPVIREICVRLRKKGIRKVKVLYSKEKPLHDLQENSSGSISFVTGIAGMMLAGAAVRELVQETGKEKILVRKRKKRNKK